MILGITGGISTGKSTVTGILERLGVRIVDADELAHYLTRYEPDLLKRIRFSLGDGAFTEYGALNRKAVAELVFGDEGKRRDLEAILHPAIRSRIVENITAARESGLPLVVSAPLMYESGLDRLMDKVWVVSSTEQKQIERLCNMRGMAEEHARRRIDAQLPLSEKEELADLVIFNNGSIDELESSVQRAWQSIVRV